VTIIFLILFGIYAVIFVAGRAHSRHLDRLEARLNRRPNDAQLTIGAASDVDGIIPNAVDRFAICAKCGQPLAVRALGTILMVCHKPEIDTLHPDPEPLKQDHGEIRP
jgi:hypothetical protein